MPNPNDPRNRRPRDSSREPAQDGVPQEHDAFVVDTRRTRGNRRALPQARRSDDGAQAIPVRGRDEGRAPLPDRRAPRGRPGEATPSPRPQRPAQGERRSAPNEARPDSTRVMPVAGAASGASRPTDRQASQDPHGQRPERPGIGSAPAQGHRDEPWRGSGGGDGSDVPPGRGPGGNGDSDAPRPRRRRVGRGKKILVGVLVVLLVWVGSLVWAGNAAWNKVTKVDAMPAQHLADEGEGTNTLIVGSDARSGLTDEQRRKLGTGTAEGQRTDSIMVLHTGGGKPTLMSIPRDSYVTVPGHAKNKINASFSIGGPQLLIQTIEQNTGIRIDNYMEIGFGGFASVVDAVGGVDICVAHDMNDPKAHINLKKGCQTMDGATALGYVRARYSDPEGDIGRAKRQRQFLGALMKEIASPANLLVPWKLKGLGESGAQGLAVDKDMSMVTALRTMWTLKKFSGDGGNSVVVPIGNPALPTRVGEAVEWDAAKSAELFKAIRENGDTSPFVKKTTN